MKLSLWWFVCSVLGVSLLAGCGGDQAPPQVAKAPPVVAPPVIAPEAAPAETPANAPAGTPAQAPAAIPENGATESIRKALEGLKINVGLSQLLTPEVLFDFECKSADTLPALEKLQGLAGTEFCVKITNYDYATDAYVALLPKLPGLRGVTITLSDKCTLASIKALSELKQLKVLSVDAAIVKDEQKIFDYGFLKSFTSLQYLDLKDFPLNHASAQFLPEMKGLLGLHLTSCGINDADFAAVEHMPDLRELTLASETETTNAGFQVLNKLTKLEHLSLWSHFGVDDTGCRCLAVMPLLKTVDLRFLNITDATLEHLAQAKNLEVLKLWETKIVGSGFQHFTDHTKLRELEIQGCSSLTGAGLGALAKCSGLTHLDLNRTVADNAGLADVAKLTSLTFLQLPLYDHPNDKPTPLDRLNEAGLKHLAALTNLEELHVFGNGINDAGLAHLKTLTKLKELEVGYTMNVTGSGFADWKGFTQFDYLNLSKTTIPEGGTKYLVGLKTLRRLGLPDGTITDASIPNLIQLPKLEYLYGEHKFTEDGRKELSKALENLIN